jgi:hypothetical protein
MHEQIVRSVHQTSFTVIATRGSCCPLVLGSTMVDPFHSVCWLRFSSRICSPLLLLFFHAHAPSWVQGSALSDWPPNSHLSSSTCFYCRCAPCTAVQHSKSPSSFLHHCPESRERFSLSLSLSLVVALSL